MKSLNFQGSVGIEEINKWRKKPTGDGVGEIREPEGC